MEWILHTKIGKGEPILRECRGCNKGFINYSKSRSSKDHTGGGI